MLYLHETDFSKTWLFRIVQVLFIVCKSMCQITYTYSSGLIISVVLLLKLVANRYKDITKKQLQTKEIDINAVSQFLVSHKL